MAASVKAKAKSAKTASSSKSSTKPPQILELLLARAPAEDVADYEPGMLERAAQLAEQAVLRHRKGSSVIDIETDANDASICAAIIALGHNLGLELVAEGVETEMQREFLTRLGCDYLQGYLYSKPKPFDEIIAYLRAQPPLSA